MVIHFLQLLQKVEKSGFVSIELHTSFDLFWNKKNNNIRHMGGSPGELSEELVT